MKQKNLILATAGHVDHGKTALVRALTGVETDRLPEEKARGITIEAGFAHFELSLPNESEIFSLGVIDLPGHEDFIRNMIAGIGSIDLALLVVAADDGWMPQTEEHLQILNYLGVRRGVVAVTKCDLGDGSRTMDETRQRLRGSSLGDAPVVPTSVSDLRSVAQLRAALAEVCRQIPRRQDLGKARLFVDRAFTMRGSGTIVTGTLTDGRLAQNETVFLQPQNLRARVRSLQSHNRAQEKLESGMRGALNLADRRVDEIPRGTIVTTLADAKASRAMDVLVFWRSERLPQSAPVLKKPAIVQVHYGSGRWLARINLLEGAEVLPGGKAIARLSFSTPIFTFVGDRFVLRDSSARHTLGGGVILEPDAAGTRFRAAAHADFLRQRALAPNDLVALLRSQLQRDGFALRAGLLRQSNFSEEEIAASLEKLVRGGEILQRGEIVAAREWWESLFVRATELIDATHAARPNEQGLELTQLRKRLSIRTEPLFESFIEYLCANGFARAENFVRRRGHRLALPPQLQRAIEALRAALATQPFDPPSKKDLLHDAPAQEALRFLLRTNEVVALSDEVVLGAPAFEKLRERVTKLLQLRGAATTSELRQSLGTTRRVLVPLLEYFDRLGLTMRQGDQRVLRRKTAK